MNRLFAARTLGLGLLLLASPATPAVAGAPTETLQQLFAGGERIFANPAVRDNAEAALRAAHTLVAGALDMRNAAADVLGDEWERREPGERAEFVRLLTALVERSYLSQVLSRARGTPVPVRYVDEVIEGDTATVRTEVESRDGTVVTFDYRMGRDRGDWLIRDVVIGGVSVVGNYRSQVARVLKDSSYRDLVSSMRLRLSEPPTATASASLLPAVTPAPAGATGLASGRQPSAIEPANSTPGRTPWGSQSTSAAAPAPAPSLVSPAASAPSPAAPAPSRAVSAVLPVAPASASPAPAPATTAPAASTPAPAGAPEAFTVPAITTITPTPRPAVAAPPTPIRVASVTPSAAAYWIQVGAFRDVDRAKTVMQQLRFFRAEMLLAGQSLTRIRLGPFASRSAALSARRNLERTGFRAFITRDHN